MLRDQEERRHETLLLDGQKKIEGKHLLCDVDRG